MANGVNPLGAGQQPAQQQEDVGAAEFLMNVGAGLTKILSDPTMAKNYANIIAQASNAQLQQERAAGQPQMAAPATGVMPQQQRGTGMPLGAGQQQANPLNMQQVAALGNAQRTGALNLGTIARKGQPPAPTQVGQGGMGALGRLSRLG